MLIDFEGVYFESIIRRSTVCIYTSYNNDLHTLCEDRWFTEKHTSRQTKGMINRLYGWRRTLQSVNQQAQYWDLTIFLAGKSFCLI